MRIQFEIDVFFVSINSIAVTYDYMENNSMSY